MGDTGGGNYDLYLTKTDSLGNVQWCKTYGGANVEIGWSVKQTADGGFIAIGQTNSFGSGNYDMYLIKTDSNGNSSCNQNSATPIVNTVTFSIDHFSASVLSGSITGNPSITEGRGISLTSLCITTDVAESTQNNNTFIVSPNPFISSTTLSMNIVLKNANLIIYDILGKEIKRRDNISGQEIFIDRDNLGNGIYFYRLEENNKIVSTGKLIAE